MRVVDLVEKLSQFDPDTLVLVSGYEGNYESGIVVFGQAVMKRETAYHGDYDDFDAFEGERVDSIDAVVVARDTRARRD